MAIGPRPSGSPANAKTRQYITAQLAALGIKTVEQPFDGATPIGPIKMVNLIGTIPGKSPDRIILASHFDTKLFREVRFVGASDGASSTAALLELARVLKARKDLPFTIELLFFDGEEAVGEWQGTDNTYGSRHYVDAARKSGSLKSIRALILLDMIGDRNLTIRRDPNSTRWLTDIIWAHGEEARPPPVHGRGDGHRGRSPAVPESRRAGGRHHRPRLPRVAHRRRTRWTRSPRAACRLSAMSWWRRCRKSKRGCLK